MYELMNSLTHGTHTYRYRHVPAAAGAPTLLMLHGFPDDHNGWNHQIDHFTARGYGALAPDMLGYGATSKPNSATEYRLKPMVDSLVAILDAEGLGQVVVCGHNWGVAVAARLSLWYPQRVLANVWTSVGYFPPSPGGTDIKAAAKRSIEAFGYNPYAYWSLFTRNDADEVCRRNIDSFLALVFPEDAEGVWRDHLVVEGGAERWIDSNTIGPLASYYSEEERKYFKESFGRNGFPFNWYNAYVEKVNTPDDAQLLVRGAEGVTIKNPSLMIFGKKDPVGLVGHAVAMKPYVPDLDVKVVDAGHWIMREKPQEWNAYVEEFLKRKGFGVGGAANKISKH